MTHAPTETAEPITGASLTTATFSTRGFSRAGYDPQEVDAFLLRSAAAVDNLTTRLTAAEQHLRDAQAEIARLQDRIDRDSRTDEVQQAVTVLTSAQITADATVAHADQYSARVMTEARDLYEDTRRNAAILEQEIQDKARAVYEDALLRVEAHERENEERLAQLALNTAIAQQELDDQTAYLRTLRDASMIQLERFLEGLLDHLAQEYGRAHPDAAQAATGPVKSTNNGSPGTVAGTAARRAHRNRLLTGAPTTASNRPAAPIPDHRRRNNIRGGNAMIPRQAPGSAVLPKAAPPTAT